MCCSEVGGAPGESIAGSGGVIGADVSTAGGCCKGEGGCALGEAGWAMGDVDARDHALGDLAGSRPRAAARGVASSLTDCMAQRAGVLLCSHRRARLDRIQESVSRRVYGGSAEVN